MTSDFYATLGLDRRCTVTQIRAAYRSMARRHHPDVNPGNRTAEERFKEISQAYEVLADPAKRKLYDEFGMAGVQAGFDPNQARAYRDQARSWQSGAGDGGDFGGGGGAGGFGGYTNFEDIFGDIFSGRGGAQSRGFREPPMQGSDAEYDFEIGLMEALRGLSTTISIQRPEPCPTCHGNGLDPASVQTCPECKGEGRVKVAQGPVAFMRTCPRCGGAGQISAQPCPTCQGSGQRLVTEKLTVRIPAGVDTGSRVRVAGKGSPGHDGAPPGDLYIRVKVRPHPILERREHDLYMDLPVTVGEAMLGASIEVPTLDGSVKVRVPARSQAGRQLRVRGKGAPHLKDKERGDLYLKLVIRVPDTEAASAVEAAKALDAAYPSSPRADLRL